MLESWEIILYQLSIGSLIGGIILFLFSLITAELHTDHDDVDVSDLSDVGSVELNTEFHIDGSVEISNDFETDVGDVETGHDQHHDSNSTPIMLVVASFFLMFGAVGYTIYQAEMWNPLVRIIVVLIAPMIFVKVISYLWKRFASSEFAYEVPTVKIDNQVKAITNVDENGGLVVADTSDIERVDTLHLAGDIKMQARTLPGVKIERNNIAYVIAIEKSTLIIDHWPKAVNKK